MLTDGDSRVRDSEEAADSRIRESHRKAKADADDDWKEKTKVESTLFHSFVNYSLSSF